MCSLSAAPGNPVLGDSVLKVSFKAAFKTCACLRKVFTLCSACEGTCSACMEHAVECEECRKRVCPQCIVPSNDEDDDEDRPILCTECGFQCFACTLTMLKYPLFEQRGLFTCEAGEACPTMQVCKNCVFEQGVIETNFCELCSNQWCAACMDFPECAYCAQPLCSKCSGEMTACSQCDERAHNEECWGNIGGTCFVCGDSRCQDCGPIHHCDFEECDDEVCSACQADNATICAAGHLTCNKCVDKSVSAGLAYEARYLRRVTSVDMRCFECWVGHFARLCGFDSKANFWASVHSIGHSGLVLPAFYAQRVQHWWLGWGRRKMTSTFASACHQLDEEECVSNQSEVNEALSAMKLVELTIMTGGPDHFVCGLQCALEVWTFPRSRPRSSTPLLRSLERRSTTRSGRFGLTMTSTSCLFTSGCTTIK